MRRALATAILLASSAAHADEPAPAEDPKAAIADRGLVLKAGKRHFFVAVMPTGEPLPTNAKLYKAKVYFGDAKSLTDFTRESGSTSSDGTREDRDLAEDVRFIYTATLTRIGDEFHLSCATTFRDLTPPRIVKLTVGSPKDVAKATLAERTTPRLGYFLARLPGSTTYLYVDQRGKDLRLLLGKRGALKPVAIKELADDATQLVAVTAKGVLTITKSKSKTEPATATWGPAKKPATVDALPIFANRKLIYQELGVYAREPSGYPCDEL